MKLKAVSGIMLTLLLTGMLTLALDVQTVKAVGAVYIRADGSVDPSTAQIRRVGSVYTLTGNITSDEDGIVVERDNIVVDGAGYTLQGTGRTVYGTTVHYEGKGIFLYGASNVTIKNMKIRTFSCGIDLSFSYDNSIFGNNITDNGSGIWILKSANNNICRNTIINEYSAYAYNIDGIYVSRSSNNTISGNYIANADGIGIDLEYSSNNIISGNYIANNRGGGIILGDSNKNCIYKNDIANNGYSGILVDSNENNISANNITDNEGGILLIFSSKYNSVSANNITNNLYGIELSADYNSIFGNNVMNNENGVFLRQSFNNSIWHNNFVNNHKQVYKWGDSKNFWDDGYPSGGNYWSDYNGTDADGDGVGDIPYVIDENNQDNHPLMSPWTPTWRPIPLWMQWWFWKIAITTVGIVGLAGVVYFWKKRKEHANRSSTSLTNMR